jgi:hypothetical protein
MSRFYAAAQSRRDEAIDAIAPRATGKIAFGANPMNDSTVTLNGTAVTFAASPSAGQVQIGSTLAATLQNLLAALEAFTDANITLMEYFANASNLYVEALAGGAAGNALTIAASTSPASGGTIRRDSRELITDGKAMEPNDSTASCGASILKACGGAG